MPEPSRWRRESAVFDLWSPAGRQARRFHAARVSFRAPLLDAKLVNLSAVGAAIETNAAPRIGASVLCELEIAQTSVVVPGEVRWCRLGGTTRDETGGVIPVYQAGIRFSSGAPRNLLRILRAAGLQPSGGEG